MKVDLSLAQINFHVRIKDGFMKTLSLQAYICSLLGFALSLILVQGSEAFVVIPGFPWETPSLTYTFGANYPTSDSERTSRSKRTVGDYYNEIQ